MLLIDQHYTLWRDGVRRLPSPNQRFQQCPSDRERTCPQKRYRDAGLTSHCFSIQQYRQVQVAQGSRKKVGHSLQRVNALPRHLSMIRSNNHPFRLVCLHLFLLLHAHPRDHQPRLECLEPIRTCAITPRHHTT